MIRTAAAVIALIASAAWAAEVKDYPGAKVDEAATAAANEATKKMPGAPTVTIATSSDAFDKVAAFYTAQGKVYVMPGPKGPRKLAGKELKETYVILDGAADLGTSKLWVKVQRPYVGMPTKRPAVPSGAPGELQLEDIRDVTAIITSKTK